ncbi:MazG family protein [Pseudonocardia sp. HH130630-07]|uniref:MazG family protein n=1 Tax=Pseudonocardia sp. HH130630-07 TaxID=1690815 RepID=UPI000814D8A2|nr:MazG family protein [Pseudonocardia sp. HH130630-07]ANY06076.1 nucleoside triphosphate pyrophosphohydrolase [Pseudonocardia sp. HH130630-07]
MTATVVVCPRRGAALPAAALGVLRSAERVLGVPGLDAGAAAGAGDWDGTGPADLPDGTVLLVPAGHRLAGAPGAVPPPVGHGTLDAIAVMDRLRSPGGCPWDAEQTHESLLRYLVEECYELYQAVEDGDRTELREELGDVLLQVLFHARVATEHPDTPFGIDEVATGLVDKLVGRHPHVFAAGEHVATAADQDRRWDELKRAEKQRGSSLDGVAAAQPAVALAAKLTSRTARAGLPADLLPDGEDTGERLFRLAAAGQLAGADPEAALRTAARAFDDRVRTAEKAAVADGRDPHALTAQDWRRYWPSA